MNDKYYIEAGAFEINLCVTKMFTHDLWSLRKKSDNRIVAQAIRTGCRSGKPKV